MRFGSGPVLAAAVLALLAAAPPASADGADEGAFLAACRVYYETGLDPDMGEHGDVAGMCHCLVRGYDAAGFGPKEFELMARAFSDDITAFVGEYQNGEATYAKSVREIEPACKAKLGIGKKKR